MGCCLLNTASVYSASAQKRACITDPAHLLYLSHSSRKTIHQNQLDSQFLSQNYESNLPPAYRYWKSNKPATNFIDCFALFFLFSWNVLSPFYVSVMDVFYVYFAPVLPKEPQVNTGGTPMIHCSGRRTCQRENGDFCISQICPLQKWFSLPGDQFFQTEAMLKPVPNMQNCMCSERCCSYTWTGKMVKHGGGRPMVWGGFSSAGTDNEKTGYSWKMGETK